MNCIKCGRELREGQVFCDTCLQDMEKYPVKPGIAIQLPQRKESSHGKKALSRRRNRPSAEDRIRRLRKWLRTFVLLWLVTLLLLAACLYPASKYFFGERSRLPGQNYSTFVEAETLQP